MSAVEVVLSIANHEVGQHEVGGNNAGPRVEQYLASVGLGAGNPWCAAFVAFCMKQAGQSWLMTGDTWALEDWAVQRHILYPMPQRGDVFLLLGTDGRPSHTGFVDSVISSTMVATLEGNTGMVSDTDGDGVARKVRPIANMRFVRWAAQENAAAPSYVKIFPHKGNPKLKTLVLGQPLPAGSWLVQEQ